VGHFVDRDATTRGFEGDEDSARLHIGDSVGGKPVVIVAVFDLPRRSPAAGLDELGIRKE
jgi:hypothetical protein